MRPDILIVGQGLAGTMLAWQLERAGIEFAIADPGHAGAASVVAAGIINPITGRRLVKSWRYESLFPVARESYRAVEAMLGITLWHDMRVHRTFADERERVVGANEQRRAELGDFIESVDESGWWIRRAARVDVAKLLGASRARWVAAGKVRPEAVAIDRERDRHQLVIDCRGVSGTQATECGTAPWEFSQGQILDLAINGLAPNVILNRRMWVMPVGKGAAVAGATHEPGVRDNAPTDAGRGAIEIAARQILGPAAGFTITGHRAGIRVNLPDKRPVAGRHPLRPRVGVMNGLGAKGALWAPMLALQWVEHLATGAAFDAEIDVGRFARG
jgi:glycine oxidase